MDQNLGVVVIGRQSLDADTEKANRTHKSEGPLAIAIEIYPCFEGILENNEIACEN